MQMKNLMSRLLTFVAFALIFRAPDLPAQTAPIITTQPVSQTNLLRSKVTFSVAVAGTGPFGYQWQFNGTNLPNNYSNIIITVAGNGSPRFMGEGSAATNASLGSPTGVAVDLSGNLYIADNYNHRIRKVGTNGIINTFAGNGSGSFSGDGTTATNASLFYPMGVAVDTVGNLYIADQFNNRIRRVGTNGIIATVAGNGSATFAGDGGAATNASLDFPSGVALDISGNLYIADSNNERVRKIGTNGIITTVAGNGSATYAGDGGAATNASIDNPASVAFDAAGNMYIADQGNQRIRKVGTAGMITTIAGNGTGAFSGDGAAATNASLNNPNGVVFDTKGNLFIVDTLNSRIREVGADGIITTVAGTSVSGTSLFNYSGDGGPATNASLYRPYGMTTDTHGNLYIADSKNNRIRRVGTNGIITTLAGGYYGDGGAATNASLMSPTGVALDAAGNVYIADQGNERVRKVNSNGVIATVAGQSGFGFSGDGGPAMSAALNDPTGLVLGAGGNLYIADHSNERIRMVASNGIIATVAGNGYLAFSGDGSFATNASLANPSGVAADALGNLYIADLANERIRKISTNGIITTVAGNGIYGYSGDGGAATNASLDWPSGAAFDSLGNLYIADQLNNRIRMIGTNGIITTVAGNTNAGFGGDGGLATNASLNNPTGVVRDSSGNLYIADQYNERVRRVGINGIITTVAGNGNGGYAGDGGAATNASLGSPAAVSLDSVGNLYIAEQANNRIREVHLAGYPTFAITNVSATNTGSYDVIVTGPYGSVTSAVVTLTVETGPVLTVQPASQTVPAGSSPVFSVSVIGSGPFGYAWYFAGTNLLQSGSNNTCALINVTATNAGNYTVVVSNPYGNVASAPATLTVEAPPVLVLSPVSQITPPGSSPIFMVTAAGSGPFGYAWYFSGTNLIQNGAGNTLLLTAVTPTNAGNYQVVVTNAYGSATSVVATLTVEYITKQPVSQTNYAGATASFKVTPTGPGPFRYQWQFNGNNLPNTELITTIAGNGSSSFSGDGGPATNASLCGPCGVFPDASSKIYIADSYNNRLRVVDTSGIIFTVAGNGTASYSGDGGAATNASLDVPYGVAADTFGNIYFADTRNNRVREVGTNGIISTVANSGISSPYGVVLTGAGNLDIASGGNNVIRQWTASSVITVAGDGVSGFSGDGGPATSASIWGPWGVAVDAIGNLYIADTSNYRIRKVATNGIISTVAGKMGFGYSGDGGAATNATLNMPLSVAADAMGDFYIADYGNNVIREVNTDGIITTVAGNGVGGYSGDGGAATNASLLRPNGIALSSVGNLYIADAGNNRIREVQFAGYPTLVLSNVSVTNAGDYTVVISSSYGSVTSAVASLTVIPPPKIIVADAKFGFLTNHFGFDLSSPAGQVVIVDGSTNLLNWAPLFTNPAGGGPVYFFDPSSTNLSRRFYRARTP